MRQPCCRCPRSVVVFLLCTASKEKKYKEIAQSLGISENTVNVQMHKSMAFLKEKLNAYLFFIISMLAVVYNSVLIL
ncbi:sigma factor-like helix-turn-helix DNA-binding protein [Carboxylicivirga sp. 1411-1]|uniref:sigma factor-like helix-turn-helix DNA-binding protein n=1 Tax=Carboxylicivirga sp. 1411-1 TaxID=3417573 RepID=UPI003D3457AD